MARKKKRKARLAATMDDVEKGVNAALLRCPVVEKVPQYVSICRATVSRFKDEVVQRGGDATPRGLATAATATDDWCARHYTEKKGQYLRVCRKYVGNAVRAVAWAESKRTGRVIGPPPPTRKTPDPRAKQPGPMPKFLDPSWEPTMEGRRKKRRR